jgi:hypothetical protein
MWRAILVQTLVWIMLLAMVTAESNLTIGQHDDVRNSTMKAVWLLMLAVLLPSLLAAQCLWHRTHRPPDKLHMEVLPMSDTPDAGHEAFLRHKEQEWVPTLNVSKQRPSNQATLSIARRHPKRAPPFVPPPYDPAARVSFADRAEVFFVYDEDPCRGTADEDQEHTDPGTPQSRSTVSVTGSPPFSNSL